MDPLERISQHITSDSKPAPKATAEITKGYHGIGETLDIPLSDLTNRLKTNLKFRLTVFTFMANSVGVGFYNTADKAKPTGRASLEIINDFCETWNLDEWNQKLSRDIWSSGNGFSNIVPDSEHEMIAALYMLPLSSVKEIHRDDAGTVLKYVQQWGSRGRHDNEAGTIAHARWLPIDEGAFGEGIGQPMARSGIGYKTLNGKTVYRESHFETAEKIEDVASKMIYSGLPRYVGFFEGEGADKSFIDSTTAKFEKLDPLQHMFVNVKGTLATASLDTQNRFDSFIRYIDDQIVSGSMSPLIRLWSSLNFSYASSKEAVDAMFPLIQMNQRFHKRFVEKCLYEPLLVQEAKDYKKANVRLNWGQEHTMTVEEITEVFNILKDPLFVDIVDPEDFVDMFIEAGVKINKVTKDTEVAGISKLRNLIGLADKGKSVKVQLMNPQAQDPLYKQKLKVANYLVKKYGINSKD